MKIKACICLALFVATSAKLMAGSILEGKAPGYVGEKAYLKIYQEQLLFTEKTLDQQVIGADGTFRFETDFDQIRAVFIDIGGQRKVLHVEPNATYSFTYPSNTTEEGDPMPLEIEKEGPLSLNAQIKAFDEKYASFRTVNKQFLRKEEGQKIIIDFLKEVEAESKKAPHPYLSTYMFYEVAELGLIARVSIPSLVYKDFTGKEMLPDHISYMYAFNAIMAKYVPSKMMKSSGRGLWESLLQKNIGAFLDTLGTDSLVGNGMLRDWVALRGLISLYATNGSDKLLILDMIRDFANLKAGTQVGEVANLVHPYLDRSVEGGPIHALHVTDTLGNKMPLLPENKKPTYFIFWISTSPACLAEMEVLRRYHEDYGKKLNFVAVSLDENREDFMHTHAERHFPFQMLFAEDKAEVAMYFNLPRLPQYILTDETGMILIAPAASPTEKLEQQILPFVHHK
ncbi:MAG: hypothetical protein KDD36_11790 [Flavobacteriales bacterium]|nr:hypothetical protein [Flavobacteriales bacterium]